MSLLIFWPAGAPAAFVVSDSTNITNGVATTAQLTSPSGKTTADFQAGSAHDTTGIATAIDLTANKYTEIEFSLKAVGGIVQAADYEFQLVDASTNAPLDTYTVTPTGTVSSGAISGDVTQTLGALTTAATGTVDIAGVSSPTLAALTLSSAGTIDIAGVSAPTLDALTVSTAGTVDVQGALTVTLDTVTLVSDGVVGTGPISGDVTQTLAALTLASTGTVDVTGDVTQTLAALALVSTATVEIQATSSPTLATLTVTSTGTVDVAGTATPTLDALTTVSTGTVDITGALSQTLETLALLSDGVVGNAPLQGDLAQTFAALTAVSVGTVEVGGVAAPTLAPVTLTAAGTVDLAGLASITLGALASAPATAKVDIGGVLGGYPALVVADGASHAWRLEDIDGFFAIDSLTGGTTYRLTVSTFPAGVIFNQPGLIGEGVAAHFDGIDGLGVNQAVAPISSNFSLEAWFKADTVDMSAGSLGVVWTNNGSRIVLTPSGIAVRLVFGGVQHEFLRQDFVPIAGQLYHVVATYDGATFTIYINGSAVGTPQTGTIDFGTRFVLGRAELVGFGPFIGTIDEVAVYPLTLTDQQVRAHYAAGGTSPVLGALTGSVIGQVEVHGSLAAMLDALSVIPEVAWQPVARPGEGYSSTLTGGGSTSTVLTPSSTYTELVEV